MEKSMKKLSISPDAKAEREKKIAIEKERAKYMLRHVKTREEIWPDDFRKWCIDNKLSDADIGKLIFGRTVKGWAFNKKLLMTNDKLFARVVKKRQKEEAKFHKRKAENQQ